MSRWQRKETTEAELDRLIAEDKQHQAKHRWVYEDGLMSPLPESSGPTDPQRSTEDEPCVDGDDGEEG